MRVTENHWIAGAGIFRNSLARTAGYAYVGKEWPVGKVLVGGIETGEHVVSAERVRGYMPGAVGAHRQGGGYGVLQHPEDEGEGHGEGDGVVAHGFRRPCSRPSR